MFCACSKKAVIVTADRERLSDMDGCFALLGTSVESGGPILKRLCNRDIEKIVALANLDSEQGQRLIDLICGPEASPEAFKKFFESLPPHQRQRLIRSFETYGYNINSYGC